MCPLSFSDKRDLHERRAVCDHVSQHRLSKTVIASSPSMQPSPAQVIAVSARTRTSYLRALQAATFRMSLTKSKEQI
jgi:hypothetical protein